MSILKTSLLLVTIFIQLYLVSCSSSTQAVKVEDQNYKVTDAAPGGREAWLENPQIYAEEKNYDVKNNFFYVGEAKSSSKELACEKAQANLIDDIAKQIAVFVDTSIARAISESTHSSTSQVTQNSEASEETQRISSQLSRASLSNIMLKKKYWELRDYSEAGGAKAIYFCWVLSYISKNDITNLVQKANTTKVQQDPELKAKVEEKLKNIGEEYEKYQKTHN